MSDVNFTYENGDLLQDEVTKLIGVVMVRAEYSTGCHHYGICSQEMNDGEPRDWHWFDQSRLRLVEAGVVDFRIDHDTTSGAFPSGPQ